MSTTLGGSSLPDPVVDFKILYIDSYNYDTCRMRQRKVKIGLTPSFINYQVIFVNLSGDITALVSCSGNIVLLRARARWTCGRCRRCTRPWCSSWLPATWTSPRSSPPSRPGAWRSSRGRPGRQGHEPAQSCCLYYLQL